MPGQQLLVVLDLSALHHDPAVAARVADGGVSLRFGWPMTTSRRRRIRRTGQEWLE
jgi:hypothetical protein